MALAEFLEVEVFAFGIMVALAGTLAAAALAAVATFAATDAAATAFVASAVLTIDSDLTSIASVA